MFDVSGKALLLFELTMDSANDAASAKSSVAGTKETTRVVQTAEMPGTVIPVASCE